MKNCERTIDMPWEANKWTTSSSILSEQNITDTPLKVIHFTSFCTPNDSVFAKRLDPPIELRSDRELIFTVTNSVSDEVATGRMDLFRQTNRCMWRLSLLWLSALLNCVSETEFKIFLLLNAVKSLQRPSRMILSRGIHEELPSGWPDKEIITSLSQLSNIDLHFPPVTFSLLSANPIQRSWCQKKDNMLFKELCGITNMFSIYYRHNNFMTNGPSSKY